MRDISVGFPSLKVKMTLWKYTEDEEQFEVKSLNRGRPYVQAYGVKYYLTEQETQVARQMVATMQIKGD